MYSILIVSGVFALIVGLIAGDSKFITAGILLFGCMFITDNIWLIVKSFLFVATVMTPIGILTGWK